VATLNVLLGLPEIVVAATALLKVAGVVLVAACVLIIVVLTRSDARRAYR